MTNKTTGLDWRRTGVVSQKREASQEAPGKIPAAALDRYFDAGVGVTSDAAEGSVSCICIW